MPGIPLFFWNFGNKITHI
uniref:Uncharacterized protein n=1 Tax=Rhizophora mucronata TaxID=61149 RepID=A0A2P2QAX6_RHIMU